MLCGSEDLAQKILERKEYFPTQGEAKVVPVVMHIQSMDLAEINRINYELYDRPRDFRHIIEMHLDVIRRNLEKYTEDVSDLKDHLDNLANEIADLNEKPPIIVGPTK